MGNPSIRLGVVVAGDPWRFFKDIYDDFVARPEYSVSLFQHRRIKAPIFHERINRYFFNHDLENFLARQDVVFFEWASDLLAAASRLPKRAKIVTRLHRYEMFQWSNRINWANVDKVILVSHAMQKKFAERFPQFADRTTVIHEAVDTRKFLPLDKPFGGDMGTLCFLGPRKRVYELILAFAELNQKNPDLRLHIGGSGNKHSDYNDALQSVVKKLDLVNRVTFHGDVKEPWKWYRNVDIFISNSYSEGLQVAPMEAMASGRYTLSHYWDGADELLPSDHLYLTDSQLQEKILYYVNLPEDEKKLQQEEMRALACEKFDVDVIRGQIRAVVQDVFESSLALAGR